MGLLLRQVVVLDGESERARCADVAIEGGRIAAILPAGKGTGESVVECYGKTALIPGLVNAHTHAVMVLLRGLGEEKPLMEWLQKSIWPVEARLRREHFAWGTKQALLEMVSGGVTCFGDMYFEMEQTAQAALDAGVRAGLCRGIISAGEEGIGDRLENACELVRNWHGRDGLISVQLGPHAPYTLSPEELRVITDAARELGVGVHVHWLETEWEKGYILEKLKRDPVDLLEETGILDAPFAVLAHGVWFDPEALPRIARNNLTVVHNPSSNLKLGSGIAPVPEMLRAGVHVALGTDGAASNNRLDVWGEMRMTALLHKGCRRDCTVISARDVLRMATLEGARAFGFSDVGLIREGWQADLVLVDLDAPHYVGWNEGNLVQYLVYAGSAMDVMGTMVAGKWVYQNGCFPTLDVEEILAASRSARRELLEL